MDMIWKLLNNNFNYGRNLEVAMVLNDKTPFYRRFYKTSMDTNWKYGHDLEILKKNFKCGHNLEVWTQTGSCGNSN